MKAIKFNQAQPWTFIGYGPGFGGIYYVALISSDGRELIAVSESHTWRGHPEDFLIEFRKLKTT